MKMTAHADGSGYLTAEQLQQVLDSVPGEAVVSVKTILDQPNGDSWAVVAEWDSSKVGVQTSGSPYRGNGRGQRSDDRWGSLDIHNDYGDH